MTDATHIHMPSRRKVKIKKVYDSIAVCFVDPYPISFTWGKEEYVNTIIVKVEDLTPKVSRCGVDANGCGYGTLPAIT